MSHAIEIHDLQKSFKATRALAGISLAIPKGTVYGMLGPNGAGKTTTIRILATLLRPDAGTATVMGHDVVREAAAVRRLVSLTGQYASVDEDLTGTENLVLVGRLMGLTREQARQRAAELLQAFGLMEAARRQVRTYSGGMRRRIDLATSLVTTPEVLFLDEPSSGLDPRSRGHVWDIVRGIAKEGTTVLLTTQYLEEADRLAGRLAVIDQGRLIAEGTGQDLKRSVGATSLHVRLRAPEQRPQAQAVLAQALGQDVLPMSDPAVVTAKVSQPDDAAQALAALKRAGVGVVEFSAGAPSLDDVFFALTGRTAEAKATEAKA